MTDLIAAILKEHLSFNPKETDPLLEDLPLKNWMWDVLELCTNANSFTEAIDKISHRKNEYSTRIGFQDELPYSSLLSSYVHFKWGRYVDAAEAAKNAIDEFKACGKTSNQAIALWIRALAYEKENHIEIAHKDIENALFLIERRLSDYKRYPRMSGKSRDLETIRAHLIQIKNRLLGKLRSNVSSVRPPPPPPAMPPAPPAPIIPPAAAPAPRIEVKVPIDITLSNSMKATVSSDTESSPSVNVINVNSTSPLETSEFPFINIAPDGQKPDELEEISLPWLPLLLHPTARANPHGEGYIVQGDEESPTEISHITIEGQLCEIHLIRNTGKSKEHLIRLISSRKYKWMRVGGDSMKDHDPKIEDGDYALFYDLATSSLEEIDYDLVYQDDVSVSSMERSKLPDDNIVIVREIDKGTDEAVLLIKKFKSSENMLYSYNNDRQPQYEPRPLCKDCQILGIVVAIARPYQQQKEYR